MQKVWPCNGGNWPPGNQSSVGARGIVSRCQGACLALKCLESPGCKAQPKDLRLWVGPEEEVAPYATRSQAAIGEQLLSISSLLDLGCPSDFLTSIVEGPPGQSKSPTGL